ncbi:MAG TPA: SDR family oxidoreductase [Acidimicrobiales bacterium]|nr:SDR family oxidoreductase [Acidimicrobiales bacterium]
MADPFVLDPAALFGLEGRVVIVTGASSGLGARFARVLHAAGASVIVAARRVDRLDRLVGELGDRTVAAACDVRRDEDLVRLVDTAVGQLGGIDVLVNNAGVSGAGAAEDEAPHRWQHVLDVNLTAPFRLSQLALPHLVASGHGSVVNIASMLGIVASAPVKQASYCAAKGAIVNLTRELACQWARRGVRVNGIAPGWFPSEMTADEMLGDERSLQYIERNCPMGRPGSEHELDGALLYLASDASSYCTGQTLVVDGGWTAR